MFQENEIPVTFLLNRLFPEMKAYIRPPATFSRQEKYDPGIKIKAEGSGSLTATPLYTSSGEKSPEDKLVGECLGKKERGGGRKRKEKVRGKGKKKRGGFG